MVALLLAQLVDVPVKVSECPVAGFLAGETLTLQTAAIVLLGRREGRTDAHELDQIATAALGCLPVVLQTACQGLDAFLQL